MASDFPLQLDIDYPEDSNRLTVLFRLILAIPILIVAALITASHSGIQTLAPRR